MDDRTPMGVIQEKLDHYTEIFAHKEPRDAPKKKKKKKKKKNLVMHPSEFWFMDNQVSE